MSSLTSKVLILDSGVGGLSIMSAIQERLPHCEFYFASDNDGYPYGPKTAEYLVPRVGALVNTLIDRISPHIIVIACNTASTVALPHLREKIALPIVGVVPAIKPAAQLSHSKVIGLLATPGTISRPYTHQLIADFAPNCRVISIGSSELVEIAEAKLRGEAVDIQAIAKIIKPFSEATEHHQPLDTMPLDTIVLACTHFPLLYPELAALLPSHIRWIDSGDAISRRVEQLIKLHDLPYANTQFHLQPHQMRQPVQALFTAESAKIEQLHASLKCYGINEIEYIKV